MPLRGLTSIVRRCACAQFAFKPLARQPHGGPLLPLRSRVTCATPGRQQHNTPQQHYTMASDSDAAVNPGPPPGAPGSRAHHNPEGGFVNPWRSADGARSLRDVFRMRFGGTWTSVDLSNVDNEPVLSVEPLRRADLDTPPADNVQVTWLGHASCLLQVDGVNVLTDPVYSQRCSPSQWFGPKRYVRPPATVADLPRIDVVVISHDHYDHLDTNTVKALRDRVALWAVPLGIKRWLVKKRKVPSSQVVELDWWQEHTFRRDATKYLAGAELRLVCTPSQHSSGRGLCDRGKQLWCSWALVGPSHRAWFSGDTGLKTVPEGTEDVREAEFDLDLPECPAFGYIGEELGPFDAACIGIGAYYPRNYVSRVHLSPWDAVRVHNLVRSKQSYAIHWGTFTLTCEPVTDPPKQLAKELDRLGMPPDCFMVLHHGETHVPGQPRKLAKVTAL
eukprot:m.217590 g.217590  ORF g.217590 m.217590 type:complete len:446 (+) comp18673_c0_seq2:33-1370(+)